MLSPSRSLPIFTALLIAAVAPAEPQPEIPGGELRVMNPDGTCSGACPLKHTEVTADIVGFVGRVTVKQVFHNPTDQKIEAVYVFPLPQNAAVDDMVMIVGDRRIIGQIKERAEAQEIYEQARAAGHVAGLLDQERPNIFTQSVANIEPGVEVTIEISYVEVLQYEDGVFEWVFPMVVGPRYIPGGGSAPAPMTTGSDTAQVPDGSRISPPVTPKGTRAGHDISLAVHITTADLELRNLESELHEIAAEPAKHGNGWTVRLKNLKTIPNKDFILRYRLGADDFGDAFFVHEDERGRFFTLILQPPERIVPEKIVPRELIFVLDTSGSMRGFPMEKSKAVVSKLVGSMNPQDTFNVITFAGFTSILWEEPRPATDKNIAEAQRFIETLQGGGGTEMMKAIEAALTPTEGGALTPTRLLGTPATGGSYTLVIPLRSIEILGKIAVDQDGFYRHAVQGDKYLRIKPMAVPKFDPSRIDELYLALEGTWQTLDDGPAFIVSAAELREHTTDAIRVVCFLTDGYVGNDMAIIDAVKRNAHATRVFSFGIGNSVNRFLLDGMAHAGRGEVEYVALTSEAEAAVERFHERILAPVLTDIEIDWGDLPVAEVYPRQIPDLFSAKPLMIHGQLTAEPHGTIVLRGNTGDGPYEEAIEVNWPNQPPDHSAVPSLWARAKVDELMLRDYAAAQSGQFPEDLKQQVIDLGLKYRLMTQFTSFVAVEEMTVTAGGEPVTIKVPVEMPEGVSYEGVFGDKCLRAPMAHMKCRGAWQSRTYGFTAGRLGGGASAAQPPASPPQPTVTVTGGQTLDMPDAEQKLDVVSAEELAQFKLAEELRELAAKVEKDGRDGNLTVGKLKVTAYRVDVMVLLSNLSQETLAALKELGFEKTGESKAVKLLIGSIDVRKLEDLAKLDAVVRIQAVVAP